MLSLAAHQVPEAYGAEGHEAEIQGLHVAPVLHGAVQGGSAACDYNRCQAQDQHHVINGGFPDFQTVLLTG